MTKSVRISEKQIVALFKVICFLENTLATYDGNEKDKEVVGEDMEDFLLLKKIWEDWNRKKNSK